MLCFSVHPPKKGVFSPSLHCRSLIHTNLLLISQTERPHEQEKQRPTIDGAIFSFQWVRIHKKCPTCVFSGVSACRGWSSPFLKCPHTRCSEESGVGHHIHTGRGPIKHIHFPRHTENGNRREYTETEMLHPRIPELSAGVIYLPLNQITFMVLHVYLFRTLLIPGEIQQWWFHPFLNTMNSAPDGWGYCRTFRCVLLNSSSTQAT